MNAHKVMLHVHWNLAPLNIAIVIFSCPCDHSFFQADFKTVALCLQQLVDCDSLLGGITDLFRRRQTSDIWRHHAPVYLASAVCCVTYFHCLVTPSWCGKRLLQLIVGVVVLLFKNHVLSANGSNCMDACVV